MRSKMASGVLAAMLHAAMLLALTSGPALAAGLGYLGVTTQSTNDDLRRGLDLTRDGLLVNQVSKNSPADRAGLRKGDVILSYNSRTVTEPEDLRQLVRDTAPGRRISLGISRDGSRRSLQVTVGELPSADDREFEYDAPTPPDAPRAPRAPHAPRAPRDGETKHRMFIDGREVPEDEVEDRLKDLPMRIEGLEGLKELKGLKGMRGFSTGPGNSMFFTPSAGRGRLGVRIEKLNDDLGQALGVQGDKGALVTEVLEDTPAQKAGIRAGDVIVRVGDKSVDTPDELVKALEGRDGKVAITVLRKGVRRDIQAELGDRSSSRNRSGDSFEWKGQSRNPEPEEGNRVYRMKTKDYAGDDSDLREEIRQLKQELRELREQLREKK